MSKRLRRIPRFHNEAEEREFWATHDSTEFVDWSQAETVVLPNLKFSTKAIPLRLPVSLLEQIKAARQQERRTLSVPNKGVARGKTRDALR